MDVDSVRVALRIRPLVPSEIERGCQEVVQHMAGLNQVVVNRSDAFTFNHIFDTTHTQHDVYTDSVAVLVDKYFDGFNSTILAYGQTGSGKTHTMGTAFNGTLADEHVGVIPRVMYEIFERIEQQRHACEYTVSCSFMELYQEQLYDLLSAKPRDEAIVDIREDRNGIIIPGLSEVTVASAKATTDCLERGSSGRAVAATAMNQQSSRSHAIFTVTMQATTRGERPTVTTSKFHLVDLAGSERSKKTQATGDRFKEGVKINQGLLALGNVISALGSGQVGSFVRYRDSKLTRLLQDSLGGNSVTLMIACVSPADYNVPETLSTLRYADRARKIKNKPIVNQDPHAAEINHLKDVIQKLRMELLAAGGSDANVSSLMRSKSVCEISVRHSNGQSALYKQLLEKHEQLEAKYHNMQRQLQCTLHELAENELCAHINDVAHEKLKAKTNEMQLLIGELKRELTVDASREQLAASVQRVGEIYQLAAGLDEELERTQHEIDDHKRQEYKLNATDSRDEASNNAAESREMNALMQEQADEYTTKQMNFKDQLNRLNRELNIKEELHQRVAGNLDKFYTLDNNIEEKFKECETKIVELESEKCELLEKLKHMKGHATAKLAEERRKRLQALEQEIGDMKRKNMQQAKLLKVREKETQKIKNLHSEIQVMKESKVKLIRTMRQEAENFRQWKFQREKELIQLRNKDRKLQNEMARKEALHTKQRNVLKRKCEEAMAINKRLKDALDRQRIAQTQRQKAQQTQHTAKGGGAAVTKIEQAIADVERELEVILSLIDAEHSLEQLMDDRTLIKRQIAALKETTSDAADQQPVAGSELSNLEEELQMRNAQIADLQQKVCTTDMETCVRNLLDSIGGVVEARAMVKQLLTAIGEMRRDNASRTLELKSALDEQRSRVDAAEAQCKVAAKRMRMLELNHEEAIAERENAYEEKIAVLLRELHSAPQLVAGGGAIVTPEQEERWRIQEEELNKMDKLREELEYYRGMANQMVNGDVDDDDADDDADDEELDDALRDPDWKATPMVNRSRSKTSCDRSGRLSDNSTADDTYMTAQTRASKRRAHHCGCRGNCSTKRCGCLANAARCTGDCRCGIDCMNGKTNDDDDGNNSNGDSYTAAAAANSGDENDSNCASSTVLSLPLDVANVSTPPPRTSATATTTTATDKTFNFTKPAVLANVTSAAVHLTPKMARMSYISFDTPSAKKKFFD